MSFSVITRYCCSCSRITGMHFLFLLYFSMESALLPLGMFSTHDRISCGSTSCRPPPLTLSLSAHLPELQREWDLLGKEFWKAFPKAAIKHDATMLCKRATIFLCMSKYIYMYMFIYCIRLHNPCNWYRQIWFNFDA